ncbi:MAG: MMPL family transporter [Pseudomonadota bacterium]
MRESLEAFYYRITLARPAYTLLAVGLFVVVSAWFAQQFRLDASADSLVLENDADLRYYRAVRARYGSDDFLVVTYSPSGDLFADTTLASIRELRDRLASLERVESVTSILDVPLIASPPVSFSELERRVRTLQSPETDRQLARREFRESPLYSNLLVSPDAGTTALLVNFRHDERYQALLERRSELREQALAGPLDVAERTELEQVSRQFKRHTDALQAQEQEDIAAVRAILDEYRGAATIHLGGVPMITADMIDFIRKDLRVFGLGVMAFLVTLLAVAFKRPRWVLVPMLICLAAAIGMLGYLGLVEWRVTVVSSNFISLLLILTLSLTLHLVVRHQELHAETPGGDQRQMLRETMGSKLVPSIYTALTTMVAFASLIVSGIRPVIDFGWMMVFGVGLAFVMAFLLFPALLAPLPAGTPVLRRHDATALITGFLARLIQRHSNVTLGLYVLAVILSVVGLGRLTVENRFIDYFKDSTEIHQGMVLIDRQLGGTTPLDVILDPSGDFDAGAGDTDEFGEPLDRNSADEDPFGDSFDEDPFAEEGGGGGISGASYWFNIFQLEEIEKVHAYLESLDETGKVLSLSTTMAMLTQLNHGVPLDNLTLSVAYRQLPEDIKATLFDPYMSADGNQVRLGVRVIDSDINLERDALLKKIRRDLTGMLGLEEGQVHLSGMLVLYNNVLQSLYRSQILTLSVVFLAIMGMFLLLFRSWRLALIGVMPTVVAAGLILGFMGWLGIPLDIMTITIAAITIGIGVHDTIHYTHRFREEIAREGDYWRAVHRAHGSVGRAIYYTSISVTLGFSILALSNFIPTIYFGLLTGLAMVIALIANLTLLPLLMVKIRPFG